MCPCGVAGYVRLTFAYALPAPLVVQTTVIGDNCSLLHGVTLGGSGVGKEIRHPQLGNGVLIGASATILGNVRVGDGVKISAGSVVMTDLPDGCTAVGVPAKILRMRKTKEVKRKHTHLSV